MSTFEVIVLFAAGMFVGAILAFAYIFHVMLKSERRQELRTRVLEMAWDEPDRGFTTPNDLDKAVERVLSHS
jgi:hypothetical protein